MSAIRFDGVSKRFTIHHERPRSFQDLLIRGLRQGTSEPFWALRDISFTAEPGSAIGIVGTNGSGKSTLLKLATRILAPTTGKISVSGRVSALLELGAGFHPELSGRDNIFLNASIMGMRRADVAARFDAIVSFAELEPFIDTPVKHYSSGMYARLAFAVAVHVDPDVLLIDEVLSVGDESFQERCLEKIYRFRREGKTILLVSHDLASIRTLCNEAIWLDKGRLRARGDPGTVVADYFADSHAARGAAPLDEVDQTGAGHEVQAGRRWGSHEAEVIDVRLTDGSGRPTDRIKTGDAVTVRIRYRAQKPVASPVFGLAISTVNGTLLAGPNTKFSGLQIPRIDGDGSVLYRIKHLDLLPGEYVLSASIYDEACLHPYDYHDRMYSFSVVAGIDGERYGLIRLPADWQHEPGSMAESGCER